MNLQTNIIRMNCSIARRILHSLVSPQRLPSLQHSTLISAPSHHNRHKDRASPVAQTTIVRLRIPPASPLFPLHDSRKVLLHCISFFGTTVAAFSLRLLCRASYPALQEPGRQNPPLCSPLVWLSFGDAARLSFFS